MKKYSLLFLCFSLCLCSSFSLVAQQFNANAVSALGFIEPEGGIIKLSGAVSADGGVVAQLNVQEGQQIQTVSYTHLTLPTTSRV